MTFILQEDRKYLYSDNVGVQCHAGCRALIPEECNFGMLQPIFLPPSAVSIPRTEVPMEAIIGVHVRPPPSQRDFGCRKSMDVSPFRSLGVA